MNLWNWKAGVLSAVYRAPVFFLASLKGGWQAALAAMTAEIFFRIVIAGFYGAFTQAIRRLEPPWLSVGIILVLAPVVVQTLEFGVHRFSGTANLKTGILISSAMTAISSLFNWYAMRHGAMLTGQDARPFGEDLRRLPGLIFGFVAAIPQALFKRSEKI